MTGEKNLFWRWGDGGDGEMRSIRLERRGASEVHNSVLSYLDDPAAARIVPLIAIIPLMVFARPREAQSARADPSSSVAGVGRM